MMSVVASNRDTPVLHHDLATSFANAGLAVIPCRRDGDRGPLVTGWTEKALTVDEVHQWWRLGAEYAIGLVCGLSGLLVVDDDLYKQHETFERIAQANHDPLTMVPRVSTPRGGTHYYFRQRHDIRLGCARGTLPAGIDVKGDGGFVFAPGSCTAFGFYSPLTFGQILNAPPVPDWLVSILQPASSDAAPAHVVVSLLEAIKALQLSLMHLDPDCSYRRWQKALFCIWWDTQGSEEGRQLAHAWSRHGSKYDYHAGRTIDANWTYWRNNPDKHFRGAIKYSGEHILSLMVRDQTPLPPVTEKMRKG